ncbi:hypothetical protein [Saccharopolyspora dendranthemae]|uniref:Excreted virulence factor EspC (Type VII ESX diderm) n=1 Tax=Saccharopolyspora dendranthemae TaxID=1181886 RepID=A0A561TZN5_9PSEU|nr:hypothetical protein [Saccharopolyspora dendranthemae]TWF92573.1 hypothetical protein FHU35_17216 [Saccharopolyspora dendranthemae]
MNGFYVDHAALDSIRATFSDASSALDGVGKSIPGTPDAGVGTPAVAAVVAHLVENASSLVLGLAGAGDDVEETNRTYKSDDAKATEELRNAVGEP